MQEKRRLAADAWRRSRSFRAAFEYDFYGRRATLAEGRETNIYFVCELEDGAPWKIGRAQNVVSRFSALRHANPRPLGLFSAAPATDAMEKYVHYVLRREHIRGEWFRPGPRTLVLAEKFLSVGEICHDMLENDCGPVNSEDTIACLVSRIEDALAERKQAAA